MLILVGRHERFVDFDFPEGYDFGTHGLAGGMCDVNHT
jgi:hypothetical protein